MGLTLLGELHYWFLEAGSQSILRRIPWGWAAPGLAVLPLIQRVLSVLSLL